MVNDESSKHWLSEGQRRRGQTAAILTNVPARFIQLTVIGSLMMLYANDVLGLSTKKISGILSIIPIFNTTLPLLLLPVIARFKKTNILATGFSIRILVIGLLLLIPASRLSFPIYFALLLVFAISQRLGQGLVWQPLLRNITTSDDRGQFFSRMRFVFLLVSTVAAGIVPLIIGKQINESQYKAFLLVVLAGLVTQFVFCRRIPERSIEEMPDQPSTDYGAILKTIRTSPLLRRPLLINVLIICTGMPIYVLYLKKMLFIPSNLIQIHIFMTILGGAISILLWGKVSDSIGYRPTLIGLLLLSLPLPLLQFMLTPLSAEFSFSTMTHAQLITIGVLVLLGFLQGFIGAGRGIALTSIQHSHTGEKDSIVAMNLFAIVSGLFGSAIMMISGFLLDDLALPIGSIPFFNGNFHFDWLKGYVLAVSLPLNLVIVWQVSKLTNTRPYSGIGIFFNTLSIGTLRVFTSNRLMSHEDDERRVQTAHSFGTMDSPLSVDSLITMLDDPDYDVRIEAVRSLGYSKNQVAGEKLLEIFNSPRRRRLADQIAWALGELRYEPAVDSLILHLSPDFADRIRAMSARALGKIGNPVANESIAHVLRDHPADQHLVASCTRALLRLDWEDYSALVFNSFKQLDDREERFELVSALCSELGVSNKWILTSKGELGLVDTLLEYIDKQSDSWQSKHKGIVGILQSRDPRAASELFCATAPGCAEEFRIPIKAMSTLLEETVSWAPVHVLALAWVVQTG